MANPNPSPATRFKPGEHGRVKQKGDRDRLSAAFLHALADDFEAHGLAAIQAVRQADPGTYLRIVANVIPKAVEIAGPLDSVSDDELVALIEALREQVAEQQQSPQPIGGGTLQ